MTYKVRLTLVTGERIQRPDTYDCPTPNKGARITVNVGNTSTTAQVTAVRKDPSKSTRIPIETVDEVDAQEN